jgi:predicted esterase
LIIDLIPPVGAPRAAVLLLHGLDMSPAQLAPLMRALKLPAWVALPEGPVARPGGQRAWWPVDDDAREARLARGPSDLVDDDPPGREAARARVCHAASLLRERAGVGLPLLVAGFSQGAMLALDVLLVDDPPAPGAAPALCAADVQTLFLWSGSRLAFRHWQPRLVRLRGLDVQQRHGRRDTNLGLDAALALRDALAGAGARVDWADFEGGHEIALGAWAALRRRVRDFGDEGSSSGVER